MPILTFLCHFLLCFGPSLSIFIQNIWPYAPRLIICIIGTFLYYGSISCTSFIFFILESIFNFKSDTLNTAIILYSIINVISIEISRVASVYLYIKFNHYFNELIHKEKISINTPINFGISIASGYSIASAAYSGLNVVIFSLSSAVFGIDNKTSSKLTQFTVSNTCSLSILNFLWTVLIYKGCDLFINDINTSSSENLTQDSNTTTFNALISNKKFIKHVSIAISTHLINTIVSIVFSNPNTFIISSISAWLLTICLSIYTFATFGATTSSIKAAIKSDQRVSNGY